MCGEEKEVKELGYSLKRGGSERLQKQERGSQKRGEDQPTPCWEAGRFCKRVRAEGRAARGRTCTSRRRPLLTPFLPTCPGSQDSGWGSLQPLRRFVGVPSARAPQPRPPPQSRRDLAETKTASAAGRDCASVLSCLGTRWARRRGRCWSGPSTNTTVSITVCNTCNR